MDPYTQQISRQHKALFVLLLDQSLSMEETLGNSRKRKMDELVTAINSLLQNLVIQATKSEGVRDYLDIAVIGYRTDQDAVPIIETPLTAGLQSRDVVSIVEISQNTEIETRMQEYYDDESGEMQETQVEFPVWVQPQAEGGTPMCTALHHAYGIVDLWIEEHRESFPPIVIHVTDGECSEPGDPIDYAVPLTDLVTSNGNVLLFNCHLSMTSADPFLFPHSSEILPDDYARLLFKMSSEFPEPLFQNAVAEGFDIQPNARGMAFNADMVSLIKFLDLGTRVAHQLR